MEWFVRVRGLLYILANLNDAISAITRCNGITNLPYWFPLRTVERVKYIRQGDEGHTLKITSTTFCYFHLTSLVFFPQQKLVIYYLHTFVFHLLGLVINWTPDPHLIRTLREIEIKKRQVIDRYYVSERFWLIISLRHKSLCFFFPNHFFFFAKNF